MREAALRASRGRAGPVALRAGARDRGVGRRGSRTRSTTSSAAICSRSGGSSAGGSQLPSRRPRFRPLHGLWSTTVTVPSSLTHESGSSGSPCPSSAGTRVLPGKETQRPSRAVSRTSASRAGRWRPAGLAPNPLAFLDSAQCRNYSPSESKDPPAGTALLGGLPRCHEFPTATHRGRPEAKTIPAPPDPGSPVRA